MKVEQQTLVLKEKGFDVKKIMENTDLDKLIRAPTGRSELSRLDLVSQSSRRSHQSRKQKRRDTTNSRSRF